jgi:hypothetical protein
VSLSAFGVPVRGRTFAAADVLLGPRGQASGVGDCPRPGAVLPDLPLDLADGVGKEVLVLFGVERAGRASKRVAGNLHDLVAVKPWLHVSGADIQRNTKVESDHVIEERLASTGAVRLRSSGQRAGGAFAPLTARQHSTRDLGLAGSIEKKRHVAQLSSFSEQACRRLAASGVWA